MRALLGRSSLVVMFFIVENGLRAVPFFVPVLDPVERVLVVPANSQFAFRSSLRSLTMSFAGGCTSAAQRIRSAMVSFLLGAGVAATGGSLVRVCWEACISRAAVTREAMEVGGGVVIASSVVCSMVCSVVCSVVSSVFCSFLFSPSIVCSPAALVALFSCVPSVLLTVLFAIRGVLAVHVAVRGVPPSSSTVLSNDAVTREVRWGRGVIESVPVTGARSKGEGARGDGEGGGVVVNVIVVVSVVVRGSVGSVETDTGSRVRSKSMSSVMGRLEAVWSTVMRWVNAWVVGPVGT